jgi:hypothetical protein
VIRALIGLGIALVFTGGGIGGYATYLEHRAHDYPQSESYTVTDDPMSEVDAALDRAALSGKRVLLVMGANWCHDSRALAGRLTTGRIGELVAEKYEMVFVNVGMPQSGDGHNLAIARRFGIDNLPGTPNLLVLSGDGSLLNARTATDWRNAASRSEAEIHDALLALAVRD